MGDQAGLCQSSETAARWRGLGLAAIHVIRLILGGVLDNYPKLQIVIAHMGETLPFMLHRLDVMPMAMTKLKRPMSAYLIENVHYTFSGFNFTPTFLNLLLHVGVERIMFS